jgi:hypothetical protein
MPGLCVTRARRATARRIAGTYLRAARRQAWRGRWSGGGLRRRQTVTRRLHAAGLAPAREDGRTTWYATRAALAALYQAEARRNGTGTGGNGRTVLATKRQELALALPLGIDDPLPTEPDTRLCPLYGWTWPDFAELLCWGLPYSSAGRPDSLRGWRICFAHAARYLALLAAALDLEVDADFPAELARLRGGEPRCVPGPFSAPPRGSRTRREGRRRDVPGGAPPVTPPRP